METSCGVTECTGCELCDILDDDVSSLNRNGGCHEVSSCSERQEHVTELGQGRVSQDFLDVHVVHCHGGREECGDSSDDCDDEHHIGVEEEQGVGPCDKVHSRLDHGCGVDKCGHSGRSGHCVGKPVEQGELGGLADDSTEDEERGKGHETGVRGVGCCEVVDIEYVGVLEVTVHCEEQDEQSSHETYISHPGDEECLLCCGCGVVGLVVSLRVVEAPESDEEVGAETHDLPEDEHLKKGAGDCESEHSGKEESDFCEVPPLPLELVFVLISSHVSKGVGEDHRGDEGCEEHHQAGEDIDVESEGKGEVTDGEPVDVLLVCVRVVVTGSDESGVLEGYQKRQDERGRGTEDNEVSSVVGLLSHLASEESDDGEAEHGDEGDEPGILHNHSSHAYHLIDVRSSAFVDFLTLYALSRIAIPTATSAAATEMVMITMT